MLEAGGSSEGERGEWGGGGWGGGGIMFDGRITKYQPQLEDIKTIDLTVAGKQVAEVLIHGACTSAC